MSRVCTVCNHLNRAEIETAFVSGVSYRDIAGQFQISKTAVQRHASEHISQSIQQSQLAMDEARGIDVVRQLKDINTVTLEILQEARNKKKNGMALFAIDRIIKQLELQAKLLGDIDKPQVNIILMPEWRIIRSAIIRALAPYPDVRTVVVDAIEQAECVDANIG